MKSLNSVANFQDVIQIGKIVAPHGIRGAVKVYSFTESTDLYRVGAVLLLVLADKRRVAHRVKWVKAHKGILRLAFEEITDRNQAETLTGSGIFVEKKSLPILDDDTYYWFELIGLSVFTTDGQFLGKLEQIIATGSNDVYVVKDRRNRSAQEILIPALKTVVRQIDLAKQRIEVDLPEGLI